MGVRVGSTSDPDQEYIYFTGSETVPSACYILSDESSIPIYSTSNGYNNKEERYSRVPRLSDTRYSAK